MPFTPLHLGPHAAAGLSLGKRIDLPVFLLTNVVVDLESLIVLLFNPPYPVHGYLHTFLGGTLAGLLWALVSYPLRPVYKWAMKLIRLPYDASLKKMVVSAVLGVWLHILFDALLYADIHPFWPFQVNPLLGLLPPIAVYLICVISGILAIGAYLFLVFYRRFKNERPS